MRILIISAAFPPMQSGEATNAFYLSQHLADYGFEVHVLTTRRAVENCDPRVKIHPIMRDWSWTAVLRFRRFLRQCSPDAILLMHISWIYHNHPMITFAPTIAKKLFPRVPFVTRFENVFGGSSLSLMARLLRKGIVRWIAGKDVDYTFGTLLRDSDRLILLSDRHRAPLPSCFHGETNKVVLIPPPPNMRICPRDNGASRQKGRDRLHARATDFLIAYLGFIYPKKGVEILLKAFQIVRKERNEARLVLIGGSISSEAPYSINYIKELRDLSRGLGIDEQVTWLGEYKWDDETSVYLHAADVCVLPFENGVHLNNSSFSSAMAHELPVITTRGSMLDQPIIHGENVLLCPPKDPESLADAIKSLMDNPELRRVLARGARQLAAEWFSWEKAIDRTIRSFEIKNNSGLLPLHKTSISERRAG